MSDLRFDSEHDLIEAIRKSAAYKDLAERELPHKIAREKKAWVLVEENKGKYTRDVMDKIFDAVDLSMKNKRWFGALLAMPNRNLIYEAKPETINRWFAELLFSKKNARKALNACLKDVKIKGASKGLATLLLYLSDPKKNNIWVNATEEGLVKLNRIKDLKGDDWGQRYSMFNEAAIDFRDAYQLKPQEVDWMLTFVSAYVESEDDHFQIDEDVLKTKKIAIAVDDEPEIDDIVGEPMELEVMRWSPTNEMGVVALFIGFRKELGFPIVDVIRVKFPDAAVFENSPKGYVRRYIEFEFKASGYKAHLKSKRKCHYVVCWEDDWKDCPIPVIELKTEIPKILARRKVNISKI